MLQAGMDKRTGNTAGGKKKKKVQLEKKSNLKRNVLTKERHWRNSVYNMLLLTHVEYALGKNKKSTSFQISFYTIRFFEETWKMLNALPVAKLC